MLNFLSRKVLEYQKKKLAEAKNNLEYYISKKDQLENNANSNEIEKTEKMIGNWKSNIEKIKKEIKKIEN